MEFLKAPGSALDAPARRSVQTPADIRLELRHATPGISRNRLDRWARSRLVILAACREHGARGWHARPRERATRPRLPTYALRGVIGLDCVAQAVADASLRQRHISRGDAAGGRYGFRKETDGRMRSGRWTAPARARRCAVSPSVDGRRNLQAARPTYSTPDAADAVVRGIRAARRRYSRRR